MDQEILLEQIMQYTIGAYEIIPDIQDEIGKEYHLALLPQAHHLASGVFLAAGYLLLPPRAHTIFIIPDDSSQITQMEGTIGPILGQSRAFTKIGTWKPTNTPELSSLQSILQHLAFSHTINQTSVLSCLRVGEQISPAQQKKLFDYLRIHLSDTNIIVIQDLT